MSKKPSKSRRTPAHKTTPSAQARPKRSGKKVGRKKRSTPSPLQSLIQLAKKFQAHVDEGKAPEKQLYVEVQRWSKEHGTKVAACRMLTSTIARDRLSLQHATRVADQLWVAVDLYALGMDSETDPWPPANYESATDVLGRVAIALDRDHNFLIHGAHAMWAVAPAAQGILDRIRLCEGNFNETEWLLLQYIYPEFIKMSQERWVYDKGLSPLAECLERIPNEAENDTSRWDLQRIWKQHSDWWDHMARWSRAPKDASVITARLTRPQHTIGEGHRNNSSMRAEETEQARAMPTPLPSEVDVDLGIQTADDVRRHLKALYRSRDDVSAFRCAREASYPVLQTLYGKRVSREFLDIEAPIHSGVESETDSVIHENARMRHFVNIQLPWVQEHLKPLDTAVLSRKSAQEFQVACGEYSLSGILRLIDSGTPRAHIDTAVRQARTLFSKEAPAIATLLEAPVMPLSNETADAFRKPESKGPIAIMAADHQRREHPIDVLRELVRVAASVNDLRKERVILDDSFTEIMSCLSRFLAIVLRDKCAFEEPQKLGIVARAMHEVSVRGRRERASVAERALFCAIEDQLSKAFTTSWFTALNLAPYPRDLSPEWEVITNFGPKSEYWGIVERWWGRCRVAIESLLTTAADPTPSQQETCSANAEAQKLMAAVNQVPRESPSNRESGNRIIVNVDLKNLKLEIQGHGAVDLRTRGMAEYVDQVIKANGRPVSRHRHRGKTREYRNELKRNLKGTRHQNMFLSRPGVGTRLNSDRYSPPAQQQMHK